MDIKRIENISNEDVELSVGNGTKLVLSPGSSFKNIRVDNLNQVKEKVNVVADLGEINESHPTKMRLDD